MFTLSTRKAIINEYLRIQYLLNNNQVNFLSDLTKYKYTNSGFHPYTDYINQIINYYINFDKMTKKNAYIKLNSIIGIETTKEKQITF
tara:strand:- start:633 stop:896 length:264 start_codon:yes stop_codon:yes gene_type:complete